MKVMCYGEKHRSKEGDYMSEDTIAVLTGEDGKDIAGNHDAEMAGESGHDQL